MKFKVTDDNKFLQLISSTQIELEQLEYSFTKKVNSYFIIKKKVPHWDGEVKFIDRFNRIPRGLWKEVKNLCDKYNFSLEIEGSENLINKDYNEEDIKNWTNEQFKEAENFYPREYQLEALRRVIKYNYCTEEISTSGGKTLIAFMIFKYLLDRGIIKSMLYVVPSVNLVTQTEEKFYEYEETCNIKPTWKSQCIYSGANKSDNQTINLVIGTYQSLGKKSLDFFKQFDGVAIDECHHSRGNTLQSILLKCYNAKFKFGLSGTLPQEDTCDSFTIQAYLGPKVYELHSADLIKEGNATPVHVIGLELDYLSTDLKKKLYDLRNVKTDEKDGAKLLNLEKDTARENRKRFVYVCETIGKSTKNSLVIFSDIKNSYGRNIYNWLKENTDKTVYYIDGETKVENRNYYKEQMETQDGVIIVASCGTFSEGIDIKKVFNIYIVESHISEIIIAQILGRGMRLQEGKDLVTIIDFFDNYEYGSGFQKKNYLMRHAEKRKAIYQKRRFPYKSFKVKI